MSIDFKLAQFRNALFPILVINWGKIQDSSATQLEKKSFVSSFRYGGRTTCFNEIQPLIGLSPTDENCEKSKLSKASQFMKTQFPKIFTL